MAMGHLSTLDKASRMDLSLLSQAVDSSWKQTKILTIEVTNNDGVNRTRVASQILQCFNILCLLAFQFLGSFVLSTQIGLIPIVRFPNGRLCSR